jgi:hypothetical protein
MFLDSNTSINQVHRLCMLPKTWHIVHNLERRNGLSSWIKQPFNCKINLSHSLCSMWWIPKNQKSPKILGRPKYPQIILTFLTTFCTSVTNLAFLNRFIISKCPPLGWCNPSYHLQIIPTNL